MEFKQEHPEPRTALLTITASLDEVAAALDEAYRAYGRHVRVPGFRPGKAPRAILERYVDTTEVQERGLRKMMHDLASEAVEQADVDAYAAAGIHEGEFKAGEPYVFTVSVPLRPNVELGEYTGLSIERPVFPVTDDKVEEKVQELLAANRRLAKVTDRAVQDGDVLVAENTVRVEGATEEPKTRRNLITVGHNIPGFDDAIMGMAVGEERTFDLTYPDDYDDADLRGKKASFTVHLIGINSYETPELDDAFVKEQLGIETVAELRPHLRERLEREFSEVSDRVAEAELVSRITDAAKIEFPAVLVENEIQEETERLKQELQRRQMQPAEFFERAGMQPQEWMDRVRRQSEVFVRRRLVLGSLAAKEGLQPTEADIDARIQSFLDEGVIDQARYDAYVHDRGRRQQLASALVQKNLHDFLFERNTITDVERAEPPADSEESEVAAE